MGVHIWQGTAPTNLAIETAAGKRRCASYQSKTHLERKAKRAESHRLCKTNPAAQKLTMTVIHPVQVYGHTVQGAFTAQVNATCRILKNWHGVGKNSSLCYFHGCLYLLDKGWLPQVATRVEQVSEWITMWRGFDFDTKRKIRKVWVRNAPTLGNDLPCWNTATGAISATIVRFWKRTGNQARQVSGTHQTLVPPLMALCSTGHTSSKVSPETWRGRCGNKLLVTHSVLAWREVSSPISPWMPGNN